MRHTSHCKQLGVRLALFKRHDHILGESSKNLFHHRNNKISGMTNGDDFVVTGQASKIIEVKNMLSGVFQSKTKTGPQAPAAVTLCVGGPHRGRRELCLETCAFMNTMCRHMHTHMCTYIFKHADTQMFVYTRTYTYIVTIGGHLLRQPAAAVIPFPTAYIEVVVGPCREKVLGYPQMV